VIQVAVADQYQPYVGGPDPGFPRLADDSRRTTGRAGIDKHRPILTL
jgi:hypothetical protein